MCLLAPGPTEQFAPLCNCDTPQEFIGRGLFFKWAQYLKLCWVCAHESLCMHEQNQSSNPNRSFKYWISRAAEDVTFTGAHKDTHACFFCFFVSCLLCIYTVCTLVHETVLLPETLRQVIRLKSYVPREDRMRGTNERNRRAENSSEGLMPSWLQTVWLAASCFGTGRTSKAVRFVCNVSCERLKVTSYHNTIFQIFFHSAPW